jgi:hypothetical protein
MHDGERYDLYDIAYLAGGVRRMAETALVAVVEDGRVRAEPTGELAVVDPRRRHPVEAAVLDLIGPRPRRSAGTVRWRAVHDERLTATADRLVAAGLLRGPRRWLPIRNTGGPALTPAGRDLLRRWRARPESELSEAALVALRGPAALRDQRVRSAVTPPPPARRSGAAHWDSRAEAAWQLLPAGGWGGDGSASAGHGGSFGGHGCDTGHGGFGGHGGFDGGGHGGGHGC